MLQLLPSSTILIFKFDFYLAEELVSTWNIYKRIMKQLMSYCSAISSSRFWVGFFPFHCVFLHFKTYWLYINFIFNNYKLFDTFLIHLVIENHLFLYNQPFNVGTAPLMNVYMFCFQCSFHCAHILVIISIHWWNWKSNCDIIAVHNIFMC